MNNCCHFCRMSKNRARKHSVLQYLNCTRCQNVYCQNCVEGYLKLKFSDVKDDKTWLCAPCKGTCCCKVDGDCPHDHRHCFTYTRTKKRHNKIKAGKGESVEELDFSKHVKRGRPPSRTSANLDLLADAASTPPTTPTRRKRKRHVDTSPEESEDDSIDALTARGPPPSASPSKSPHSRLHTSAKEISTTTPTSSPRNTETRRVAPSGIVTPRALSFTESSSSLSSAEFNPVMLLAAVASQNDEDSDASTGYMSDTPTSQSSSRSSRGRRKKIKLEETPEAVSNHLKAPTILRRPVEPKPERPPSLPDLFAAVGSQQYSQIDEYHLSVPTETVSGGTTTPPLSSPASSELNLSLGAHGKPMVPYRRPNAMLQPSNSFRLSPNAKLDRSGNSSFFRVSPSSPKPSNSGVDIVVGEGTPPSSQNGGSFQGLGLGMLARRSDSLNSLLASAQDV